MMKRIDEMSKEELQTELKEVRERNINLTDAIRGWVNVANQVASVMGRQWPEGKKTLSEMVSEEIQRRDQRIAELESMSEGKQTTT